MLVSKIKEIRNGRVIVKDTTTKDEKTTFFNVFAVRNGMRVQFNSKPLSPKEADDLVDQIEKSTIPSITKGSAERIEIYSKTKDKITTHEYKGYTLEWDNENNKIPAKIISPSGKVIFTYAIGAEPTITGFNSKVNADLSKTKDADIGFIRKCIFDPEYRKARHGIGASKQKVLGKEAYNFGSESVAQALGISAKIPKEANTKNHFGVGYSDAARKFGEWAASYVTMDSKTKDANPDGTISPDEDRRRKEIVKKAERIMKELKDEAYSIGGGFRGPGIWAEVKEALKRG